MEIIVTCVLLRWKCFNVPGCGLKRLCQELYLTLNNTEQCLFLNDMFLYLLFYQLSIYCNTIFCIMFALSVTFIYRTNIIQGDALGPGGVLWLVYICANVSLETCHLNKKQEVLQALVAVL